MMTVRAAILLGGPPRHHLHPAGSEGLADDGATECRCDVPGCAAGRCIDSWHAERFGVRSDRSGDHGPGIHHKRSELPPVPLLFHDPDPAAHKSRDVRSVPSLMPSGNHLNPPMAPPLLSLSYPVSFLFN